MTSLTFADQAVRKQSRLIACLAADLERIRRGNGPTVEELQSAPIIQNWHLGARAEPALLGEVSDHPIIEGPAVTSGVYILDPELGYARTLSRWYRIGKELA